ncbi:YrdC domain-containing protein, mitochondrial [Labeo rohita]|uniref:Threonylcarbamoyl-AMP synthase n=1 Tax=Labeo rohita TaxID=84645 RepID=A0ABQ8LZD4_LABRO|nr:YrdC domain-containing protein, mitochondrial [Labeo rohita]
MCKELKTRVLRLSAQNSDDLTSQPQEWTEILNATVKALKAGQVVAVPTDTIYGLACVAQNSAAVKRVYNIKGRNGDKPLAICVGEIQDIYRYCKVSVKEELLRDLLPGPVTLVLERSSTLNGDLNPFTKLIGVRIPDHPFMRRLCQMCGEPLALTSANVSSQTSTVAANEFEDLWPSLAVVVDGGPIGDKSRLGSTVVDLSVCGRYLLSLLQFRYLRASMDCWRILSINEIQAQPKSAVGQSQPRDQTDQQIRRCSEVCAILSNGSRGPVDMEQQSMEND